MSSELKTKKILALTVNLRKYIFRRSRKNRVPKSVRKLQAFVKQHTKAEEVKIDPYLNKFCWSRGVNNPPRKVRVRVEVLEGEKEDGTPKLTAVASYIPVASFKGLGSQKMQLEDAPAEE